MIPAAAPPCTMVVLGAEGDLSHRKLMPALFHLAGDGQLPDGFTLIGVARRDYDNDGFRASVKRSLAESKEAGPMDEGALDRFARRLVEMDFSYREAFGGTEHSAYETLLVDCMMGDATLFTRRDEVEAAHDRWREP